MDFIYKTNFKKRILASLIDLLIFGLVAYLYVGFFGERQDDSTLSVHNLMTLPLFIFWFIYFIVVEGIKGATFGHQALNLKVVTLKRDKIGITEAFLRHLLDFIDFGLYLIPAIVAIKFSEKHQRLGDMVAKTIIVDTTDETQYKIRDINKLFNSND